MVGNAGVGKTCILNRIKYDDEGMLDNITPTYYANCAYLQMNNGEAMLWDTAGEEKFRSLAPIYYRMCDACIIVFDANDIDSLKAVPRWYEDIRKVVECKVYVVMNKVDLCPNSLPLDTARQICKEIGVEEVHTVSARTGLGIRDFFEKVLLPSAEVVEEVITMSKKGCLC